MPQFSLDSRHRYRSRVSHDPRKMQERPDPERSLVNTATLGLLADETEEEF
jgi:hypothetical protein